MDLTRFKDAPAEIPWIAVFIERIMPAGNVHAGIIYRDGNSQLHRLHFGWNHLLIHTKCRPEIAFAIPVFDPEESADEIFLAGFCGRIGRSEANKKIPYNLKIDTNVEFDTKTGAIKIGADFTGLSCATFAITVFKSAGNPIVDTANWPPADEEDIYYQNLFVKELAGSEVQIDKDQAVKIAPEVETPRARPEHVAGACLEDGYPVQHPACQQNAQSILPFMDAWAGTSPQPRK